MKNHIVSKERMRNVTGVVETRLVISKTDGGTELVSIFPGKKPATRSIYFYKPNNNLTEIKDESSYGPAPYDSVLNRESTLKDLINDIDNGTFC